MIIILILLNRGKRWTTDSNDVGSACAFRVVGEANTNVSSCSDKLLHETVTEKMATKLFYLYVLIFSLCHYVYLSSQKVRSGFGGLEVACWPLVPKFAGSNPAEFVRFLRGK